ncbi:MAG TPA: penicillin-binding transpeptidase domain-containing protein [Pseudomonadota bacterium]|jgi:cell division protein FtsI (penicillin-binding protein 3)|nr:penicillin-binding transpeptidase domain-containing protein [Pseudomonadota bacterium]HNF97748.1 penicillin-binding transpeptidase domain-containing protein [Pseudomonadota bacterium]HNK45317.1 penicillin-binding transpeptidase domain-containing protein [Pseudomonadota bacterium]HNN53387.1 penicillin-binding transpeptidase domain-containing protein [Pseudomonadota bacterium]
MTQKTARSETPSTSETSRWLHVRLWATGTLLTACFGVLIVRAYVLQVQKRDLYRSLAEEQYLREIEVPPHRGRIVDRSDSELAASASVDSVYIEPQKFRSELPDVARRDAALGRLAMALSLEPQELRRRALSDRHYLFLKRRIPPEEAQKVRSLALPGIGLTQEPKRYYPNRSLAGPLLGWAGVDAIGLEGVELAYDRFLRGSKASVIGWQDARGRKVMVGGVGDSAKERGHDVHLTLDKFIQFRLEQALEDGVHRARAKAGVAVAIDPRNGEVLAMASVPSVNPNDPAGARERGVRNRVVTDPFEPGSTIKPFTIGAAIEAGAIHLTDEWDCEGGQWRLGHVTIHDADPEGILTTTQVLARSSNICTSKITRRIGKEKMYLFLRQLGFFAPSGIDLPGERSGQVPSVGEWGDIAFANISFGQGMTATPIQIASAMAAIANGGILYRPHVVSKVVSATGQSVLESHPEGKRVMSPRTASLLRQMLRAVMEKKGTGDKLDIPGYPVAGKTGTAQKVDPNTRRYSPEYWASSFVGFAPYDDPRILLYVMVDEPREGHYGGEVAGPIFVKVASAVLPYLGVPPQNSPTVVTTTPPSRALLTEPYGPPVPVAIRYPGVPDAQRVPSFVGQGLGRAVELAAKAGLRLSVRGSGVVVSQEPPAGSARRGSVIQLRLAPPH